MILKFAQLVKEEMKFNLLTCLLSNQILLHIGLKNTIYAKNRNYFLIF